MEPSQPTNVVICPGCATPNEEGQDFCAKCRAPLTWHATTDPMGSIFAEGYAAGRAVGRANNPIIIMGLWLWILPIALMSGMGLVIGVGYLIHGLVTFQFEAFFSGLLASGASAVFAYFSVSMLYKGTKNFLRQRQQKDTAALQTPAAPPHQPATTVDPGNGEKPAKPHSNEQLTCLACGEAIPENGFDCPACGWSYR